MALRIENFESLTVQQMEDNIVKLELAGMQWPPFTLILICRKRLTKLWVQLVEHKDEKAAKQIATIMRPWKLDGEEVTTEVNDIALAMLSLPEADLISNFTEEIFDHHFSVWMSEGAEKSEIVALAAKVFVETWTMPDEDLTLGDNMAVVVASALTGLKALQTCSKVVLHVHFDMDQLEHVILLEALQR